MASPLSKGLIARAIGESGALISTLPPRSLADTEKDGVKFEEIAGAKSIAELNALTADKIMELLPQPGGRGGRGSDAAPAGPPPAPPLSFTPNIDGYFLPRPLTEIFLAGERAKVPLLAGTNSEEQGARSILGQNEATVEGFKAAVQRLYGDNADQVLKVYAPTTPEEVMQAATDLATARFIAHGVEMDRTAGGEQWQAGLSLLLYEGAPGDDSGRGPAISPLWLWSSISAIAAAPPKFPSI